MVKINELPSDSKVLDCSTFIKLPKWSMDTIFPSKIPLVFLPIEQPIVHKGGEDVAKKTGLSPDFIDKLVKFEDFRNEEYKDQVGIRTIGVGHNIQCDRNYSYGKTITDEQVYKLLTSDLLKVEKNIKGCLGKEKLTQGQHEALVELVFNVGIGKIKNTKLMNSIKKKHFNEAANEFNYIRAGKKVDGGLCARRIDDINRFCSGEYNERSLGTITSIYQKGLKAWDSRIENADDVKKILIIKKKDDFVKTSEEIILHAKQSMQNKNSAAK